MIQSISGFERVDIRGFHYVISTFLFFLAFNYYLPIYLATQYKDDAEEDKDAEIGEKEIKDKAKIDDRLQKIRFMGSEV